MEEIDWSVTFDRIILNWFDLIKIKAFSRVDLACKLSTPVNLSTFFIFLLYYY